jgi:hypothetical protein
VDTGLDRRIVEIVARIVVQGAIDGTLSIMVGGDAETFDAARPFQGTIDGTLTRYESGEHREQSWFKSPLRPGVLELGMEDESFPIFRDGDTLDLLLTEWVDSHRGHRGWLSGQVDTSAFRLYQDGQLIAEAVRGTAERFDVMASLPVPEFPGGTRLRWPLLVLAMSWYAMRDRL